MSLLELTALEISKKIREKEVSSVEVTKEVIKEIKKKDGEINAFITKIDEESAIENATRVQKLIDKKEITSPLAGVPVAIKDNICTKDIKTTCASKILEDFVPTYDATAYKNLKEAGAIIVGKTNMDEFAMGSTSETSYFGATKNPHDTSRVPGGSSGGSAAAVAGKEVYYSLGSDTGGSIRQPASYCGVVGIKPTYGTVSRNGLIAYGSSLDQIGPIAKNVEDAATILETIASYDEKDATSIKREDTSFTKALLHNVNGLRIGIPRGYFTDGLNTSVAKSIMDATKLLEGAGAIVEECNLSLIEYAIPAYYIIASAEASSNLSRFDGVKYGYRNMEANELHQMYKKTRTEGFGEEVQRRIMLGSFVLSSGYYDAYYLKALKTKALIKKSFDEVFSQYDLILGPVAPSTAPKVGEALKDSIKMYLSDIYTVSANLTGIPGISLPCGKDENNMPIGVQLLANCFEESKMIRAAYTLESLLD